MNSSDHFGHWSSIRSYYYDCSGSESSLSSCNSDTAPSNECHPQDNAAGVKCARLGKISYIICITGYNYS